MQRNRFVKVKSCHLELENNFIEVNDGESKDKELKIKNEI